MGWNGMKIRYIFIKFQDTKEKGLYRIQKEKRKATNQPRDENVISKCHPRNTRYRTKKLELCIYPYYQSSVKITDISDFKKSQKVYFLNILLREKFLQDGLQHKWKRNPRMMETGRESRKQPSPGIQWKEDSRLTLGSSKPPGLVQAGAKSEGSEKIGL